MSRKRKSDYYCQIKESKEAYWHRMGHESEAMRYFHLIICLNKPYRNTEEAIESLEVLKPYLGEIPHFNSKIDENMYIESNKYSKQPTNVFNSKMKRTQYGWEVDLWCLEEFEDWDSINSIKTA